MHTRYLIVGAGLAGTTCAFLLRRAGEDVTLVERADALKKSKLCGGLVTPRALGCLRKTFGNRVETLFTDHFDRMTCVTDEHTVELRDIELMSLARKDLDDYVLSRYLDLGGRLIDKLNIRNVDFEHRMVSGSIDHREVFECSYDVLIAADGALSMVRTALTGKRPESILTLEAETDRNGSSLVMEFDDSLHGYCWYIPVGDRCQVGCGSFWGDVDLDEHLESFAAEMGVSYEKRRGAFLPTGGDILLHQDDVYFLGDAAGLICPPSGEGIFHALNSADKLAKALRSGSNYSHLMKPQVDQIKREYRLRDTFYNKRFMDAGLWLAGHTPYGTQRAVRFALKHFAGF